MPSTRRMSVAPERKHPLNFPTLFSTLIVIFILLFTFSILHSTNIFILYFIHKFLLLLLLPSSHSRTHILDRIMDNFMYSIVFHTYMRRTESELNFLFSILPRRSAPRGTKLCTKKFIFHRNFFFLFTRSWGVCKETSETRASSHSCFCVNFTILGTFVEQSSFDSWAPLHYERIGALETRIWCDRTIDIYCWNTIKLQTMNLCKRELAIPD